ncbi:hypothetical protein [Paenibacillus sp. FSL L8-0708]|uniref:hypothetical protein n=1 Tax=Paenibacillus sp. FSL L8-0708 TaxID=2975311 RepID=UPI0030F9ACF1
MNTTIDFNMPLAEIIEILLGASECKTKITGKDVGITNKLLRAYPAMKKVVLDYEATGAHLLLQPDSKAPKTLLAYTASKSNGTKEYKACKVLTEFIQSLVNSLYSPYERLAVQKRYIEGEKDRVAFEFLQDEEKTGFPAIHGTTYYEHKRRGLRRITRSLKIVGLLEKIPEGIIGLGMEVGKIPDE